MNKTVFITGASSGIGLASARVFALNGYRLILNARRKERLEELGLALKTEFNAEVYLLCFDVRIEADVNESIDSLPNEWRAIDILVNNAGLALDLVPIFKGETRLWDNMIDTNIKGLLYVSRKITEGMVRRKAGHVINIGSTAAKEVYPGGNIYCATKFAVLALSQSMRMDLLPFGIHVTLINPGATETEFSLVRFDGNSSRAKAVYDGFKPLNGEDVAEAIFFAASRPIHVNIAEITLTPNAQASALVFHKEM